MQFTVDQATFLEALNRVTPVVPSKSTLPILSNVLMELEGNHLKVVATDLEISIVTTIEVEGKEDGALSVPAKKIGEIVRELDGMELSFELDESFHIILNAGVGRYQVPGIAAQEFPTLPEFEGASEIIIDSEKLSSMISRTIFAVSKDELRPALTGVFFQIRSNEIRTVATDGHRLVRLIDQDFNFTGESTELILPTKALDVIRRNLPEEDPVKIVLGNSQIVVHLPEATLYSRLIEGKYPHYESVIPQNYDDTLILPTKELIQAVRRAQIFSNPISRQIIFNLTVGQLEVTAEDIELGGRGSEMITIAYTGEEKRIGYNANYMLEILKQITTDEVRFEIGGATQAGIIKPTEQAEKEDFLMLIMPVRLTS